MTIHHIEVGQPWPGPVPPHEGAVLEIGGGGPVVLIQMPGCSGAERRAFARSFRRYALWRPPIDTPMAVWVFEFPGGMSPDMNFNARRMLEMNRRQHLEDFLDTSAGVKNMWTFILLDGKTIRGIKIVGIDPEAVKTFHSIIREQLAADYTRRDFDRGLLQAVYPMTPADIFRLGRTWRHHPKDVIGPGKPPTRHRGKQRKR